LRYVEKVDARVMMKKHREVSAAEKIKRKYTKAFIEEAGKPDS
jgi:hypothetical protein